MSSISEIEIEINKWMFGCRPKLNRRTNILLSSIDRESYDSMVGPIYFDCQTLENYSKSAILLFTARRAGEYAIEGGRKGNANQNDCDNATLDMLEHFGRFFPLRAAGSQIAMPPKMPATSQPVKKLTIPAKQIKTPHIQS